MATYYDLNAQENNENAKLKKEIEEVKEELEQIESIKRAYANLCDSADLITDETLSVNISFLNR